MWVQQPPDGFKLSLKLLCYHRYFFYPVFVLDLCVCDSTPPLGTSLFWVPSVCVAACGSCKSVTLSVLCVCRQVGWLVCALWFNLQLFVIMIVTSLKAGDNRSPQSLSQGCYYACVACVWPAFVWISTRNEWNAQNAIWSHAFGFAVSRNLITHVLTIPHVKLTQSRMMEQKSFVLRSLSPALRNLW